MANTINWNVPTIKAAKITGKSQGGRVSGNANWNDLGKSIAGIGQNINAGIKLREQSIRYEKQQQQQLLKERNNLLNVQYDKVAQIKSTNNSSFEVSKNEMLYGLMDDFVEIKTAMDDPSSGLDPAVAQKALAEINASVQKFKDFAPFILAAGNEVKSALSKPFGSAGAMAGGVPNAQQQLLLDLVEGGDVQLKNDNGAYYLYNTDDNGDVKDVFNIDEYMRISKNGTEPTNYFREIVDMSDISKDAVTGAVGSPGKPNTLFYDYETTKSSDGETQIKSITYKVDEQGNPIGHEALVNQISQSGFLDITLSEDEKEAMSDLWNDTIGFDSEGISGQDTVWDASDKTKKKYSVKGYTDKNSGKFVFDPKGEESQILKDDFGKELELTKLEFAQRYLAEKAIAEYAPKVGTPVSVSNTPEKSNKGYTYDMYEGYINTEKKIQAAIKENPTEPDLESIEGDIMSSNSTSGYQLIMDKNKDGTTTPMWYHVTLVDKFIEQQIPGKKDTTPVKVKTWEQVTDEKGIPATGGWPKMEMRTKKQRIKN